MEHGTAAGHPAAKDPVEGLGERGDAVLVRAGGAAAGGAAALHQRDHVPHVPRGVGAEVRPPLCAVPPAVRTQPQDKCVLACAVPPSFLFCASLAQVRHMAAGMAPCWLSTGRLMMGVGLRVARTGHCCPSLHASIGSGRASPRKRCI